MTRVEDLTLRLIDGQIDRAERDELQRLVTSDRDARRAHLALLTIEATLRGRRRIELADQVMTRIDEERTSRIVAALIDPPVRPRMIECRRWRRAGAIALLVGAASAAAISGVRSWAREDRPTTTHTETARR